MQRIPLKFLKLGMHTVIRRMEDAKEEERHSAHLPSPHAEPSCVALTQVQGSVPQPVPLVWVSAVVQKQLHWEQRNRATSVPSLCPAEQTSLLKAASFSSTRRATGPQLHEGCFSQLSSSLPPGEKVLGPRTSFLLHERSPTAGSCRCSHPSTGIASPTAGVQLATLPQNTRNRQFPSRAAPKERTSPKSDPSPLTDVVVAVAGGEVQGCPAFVVCSAGVGSILQELLH